MRKIHIFEAQKPRGPISGNYQIVYNGGRRPVTLPVFGKVDTAIKDIRPYLKSLGMNDETATQIVDSYDPKLLLEAVPVVRNYAARHGTAAAKNQFRAIVELLYMSSEKAVSAMIATRNPTEVLDRLMERQMSSSKASGIGFPPLEVIATNADIPIKPTPEYSLSPAGLNLTYAQK